MEDHTFLGTTIFRAQELGHLATVFTVVATQFYAQNEKLKQAGSALFTTWHRPYIALFEVYSPPPTQFL